MATTTKATAKPLPSSSHAGKASVATSANATRPSGDELPSDEAGWSGSKYVVLAICTLAAALLFLYLVSPNGNPA